MPKALTGQERLPAQETAAAALARLGDAMAPGGTVAVMGPDFRYCACEYFDCPGRILALTHVAGHLHPVPWRMPGRQFLVAGIKPG